MEIGARGADPLLIRIDDDPDSEDLPSLTERWAVRAVIRRGDALLMVHSKQAGDYKFPGGGVEMGESPKQALVREVSEECGRTVTRIGTVIVRAVEYRRAHEPGAMFRMESTYYECDVADEVHDLRLDSYEQELAFEPAWVGMEEAIAMNQRVLAGGSPRTWVTRETRVLRALLDWGSGG